MTTYPNKKFVVRDLRPGDVIRQIDTGPYGTAIVESVSEKEVVLHRPYGVTSGFIYGDVYPRGRTICYTGVETTTFDIRSAQEFFVYQREHDLL